MWDSGSFMDRFDPEVLHLGVKLLSVVVVLLKALWMVSCFAKVRG
jgi:hypothetical protein